MILYIRYSESGYPTNMIIHDVHIHRKVRYPNLSRSGMHSSSDWHGYVYISMVGWQIQYIIGAWRWF